MKLFYYPIVSFILGGIFIFINNLHYSDTLISLALLFTFLVPFGLLIWGFFKKERELIISSLIVLVITILAILSLIFYLKKNMDLSGVMLG